MVWISVGHVPAEVWNCSRVGAMRRSRWRRSIRLIVRRRRSSRRHMRRYKVAITASSAGRMCGMGICMVMEIWRNTVIRGRYWIGIRKEEVLERRGFSWIAS